MDERTFTVKELANYFEVTRTTVYEWIKKGELERTTVGKAYKRTAIKIGSVREFANRRGIDISDLDRDTDWVSPRVAT